MTGIAPHRRNRLAGGAERALRMDRKPLLPAWSSLPPRAHHPAIPVGDEQVEVIRVAPDGGDRLAGRGSRRLRMDREPRLPAPCTLPPRADHTSALVGDEQVEVTGVAPNRGDSLPRRSARRLGVNRKPWLPAFFRLPPLAHHMSSLASD